jgi:hypothetical protein
MKYRGFFFIFFNKMNSVTLPPIRVGSFQKKEKIDSQYRFQIQDCSFSQTIATSKVPHTNKYYTTREPDHELKNVKIQRVEKISIPENCLKAAPQVAYKALSEAEHDSASVSSLTETPNTLPKTRNLFKEMSLAAKK